MHPFINSVLMSDFEMDPKIFFRTLPKMYLYKKIMIVTFELSPLQASINLQRSFEVRMQLITMSYLTFCPEFLQMCKWCVYFLKCPYGS